MINLCGCFLKCCFTLLVLRIHNSFCAFTSAPALLNVPTIYIHHNNYNRRWDIVNTRYTDTGRSFRIHQHNTVVEKNTLSRKSPLWPSLRQTRLHPVTILSSCHWREESKESILLLLVVVTWHKSTHQTHICVMCSCLQSVWSYYWTEVLHARRDGILYVIVCDEYEGGGVECRGCRGMDVTM